MTALPGNDDSTLGVHDSNILFRDRNLITLSKREQLALIDAGLEHYRNENVPFWYWIAAIDGFALQILAETSALASSTTRQAAAISAMRLLSEKIRDDGVLNRDLVLSIWLEPDAAGELRSAALGYLAECGTVDDIPRLRAELAKNDYQTEKGAIKRHPFYSGARGVPQNVFPALIELRPSSVDRRIVDGVITKTYPETDLLVQVVEQRSTDIRLKAVSELRRRKAISVAMAEKLLGDDDARVRYEAMLALIASGRTMSAAQAKSILVRKEDTTGSRGLGLRRIGYSESNGESSTSDICKSST